MSPEPVFQTGAYRDDQKKKQQQAAAPPTPATPQQPSLSSAQNQPKPAGQPVVQQAPNPYVPPNPTQQATQSLQSGAQAPPTLPPDGRMPQPYGQAQRGYYGEQARVNPVTPQQIPIQHPVAQNDMAAIDPFPGQQDYLNTSGGSPQYLADEELPIPPPAESIQRTRPRPVNRY